MPNCELKLQELNAKLWTNIKGIGITLFEKVQTNNQLKGF